MLVQPNAAQAGLDNYAQQFNCAVDTGLFKPVGGCPSAQSNDAPWLVKPPQAREFRHSSSLLISDFTAYTDTPVVSFDSTIGQDGVIYQLSNEMNGLGFVNGTGNIIWRIKVNNRWVEDFEDIRTTLGTSDNPYVFGRGGIRFREKSTVAMYAFIVDPTQYALTDRVICSLAGWYYQMEPYSRVFA